MKELEITGKVNTELILNKDTAVRDWNPEEEAEKVLKFLLWYLPTETAYYLIQKVLKKVKTEETEKEIKDIQSQGEAAIVIYYPHGDVFATNEEGFERLRKKIKSERERDFTPMNDYEGPLNEE
jgi:hypothetical protein